MEHYFLYIIYSESLDQYYIGISNDPARRLNYHNTGPKGWTKRGRPWKLVFQKEFESKQAAKFWEEWIKKQKSRKVLERIIRKEFDWSLIPSLMD